ncbi:unnamed protein product [Rotaria sordida]|uniref:Uncharacterized protein n=1 Tax=Rotaria sordida TaxID=392033 RepID=A0A814LNT3_9BILA|nr:unnamed protein product [Rotaria sordida]CAF3734988.1 unnamed protein product [Rotaria sordida]
MHYSGLSLHYIDTQSHLRVFTLACQVYDYETQHAINIRSFVNKILEEFGLYLNVYCELPIILNDEQKSNYLKIEHDDLESICLYLKHFYDIIEKLICEKTPTLHLVIPYKQFLINLSNVTDDNNQLIAPLKRYIGKQLQDY